MPVSKIRITSESIIVIPLWIISCMMMGFNMDYPFQGKAIYILGFFNVAVLLYPLVYLVCLVTQLGQGRRPNGVMFFMARYFHYFYLLLVVISAHLVAGFFRS